MAHSHRIPVRSSGWNIIQKIWDQHVVAELDDGQCLLHVDRIVLHDRAGPAVFEPLQASGRKPAQPGLVFGTMDHIVDTLPGRGDETRMPGGRAFIETTRAAAHGAGIVCVVSRA